MTTEQPIDLWSPLAHKAPLDPDREGTISTAPSWVRATDRRRLAAYKVLSAYLHNVARFMIPSSSEAAAAAASARREYGDAGLLVDRIIAGIFGDSPQIVVDGADFDLSNGPELGRKPIKPQDPSPPETRAYETAMTIWTDQAEQIVDAWEETAKRAPGAQERQDWLRKWADDEGLVGKLLEAERDGVGLGDAVLALSWSTAKKRAKVEVYDPGFYFPALDTMGRVEDYPTRIHFAWEFERPRDDGRGSETWVRRVTYELGPIIPSIDPETDELVDPLGARLTAEGYVRDYPWNDEASPTTCFLTDASWPTREINGKAVEGFDPSAAVYEANEDGEILDRFDLGVDFLPVIHWPNTPASKEHFGTSSLMLIAQILDDLSASDTDVQAAQALAAGPAIALASSLNAGNVTVGPGVVFNLGPDGRMDVLDLTAGLQAITDAVERLLDRLSVNGRVPAEMLGRVKASEVPSGVALSLAFGPFGQLVDQLRLVRKPKWSLLLKFVQRFALVNGEITGDVVDAGLVPGAYLASDLAGIVQQIVALLGSHSISRRTALKILSENGIEFADIGDEIAAIEREDTDAAVKVADATGREDLAAQRLGYAPAPAGEAAGSTAPAPPAVNQVPQPGAPIATPEPPTVQLPPTAP